MKWQVVLLLVMVCSVKSVTFVSSKRYYKKALLKFSSDENLMRCYKFVCFKYMKNNLNVVFMSGPKLQVILFLKITKPGKPKNYSCPQNCICK